MRTSHHIDVSLSSTREPSPEAHPLKAPTGVVAGLVVTPEGLRLEIKTALDGALLELRWLVDQVVRKARSFLVLEVKSLSLEAEELSASAQASLLRDLRVGFKLPAATPLEVAEARLRHWVNEDPSIRTSRAIAADVTAFGAQHPETVQVDVLDEAELKRLGLNLLLAVGQASEVSPPRLVIARYTPKVRAESVAWKQAVGEGALMLLGKGITFDTGGINVKPYESFVSHMKNDMAGAALAFATFSHLVEQSFAQPLLLVIPTCENAIGEHAMRPGALVKSYRGPVVKIDHTDAEGRLILADALSYAGDTYKPSKVFCFATLTTAALQAYGPYATPVHFAEGAFKQALSDAAERVGEDVHFFPRRAWHFEANRDSEADLRNTAKLPGYLPASAGSRNAAHFFLHFNELPFVHADIFASGWNWAGDYPGTNFGATGAFLATLVDALTHLSHA